MAISKAHKLFKEGLNLQAVFKLSQLPDGIKEDIDRYAPGAEAYQYLIVLASAGSEFWRNMRQSKEGGSDPVDSFFIRCAENIFEGEDYNIIYPGNHFLPELAGWHHDSTMGLGIHPEFGLWFAYRGLVLSNSEFIPYSESSESAGSPCETCRFKFCVQVCPANAVTTDGYRVQACKDYRLASKSLCQTRCVSRQACPIGKEHRYLLEQLQYHYGFSLAAIRKYST